MEIYQLFLFSTLGVIFYHPTSPAQIEIVSILRVAYVIAWALLFAIVALFAMARRNAALHEWISQQPRRRDCWNLPQGAAARLCDRARHQGAEFSRSVLTQYFALALYGITIPLLKLMLFLPLVFLAAALPIAVAHLGPARRRGCCFFRATRRRRKFSPTASPRTSPSCSAMA